MNINDKNKSKDFEFLFNAVLKLETVEECYSFFEDLCTMQELISIAQRLRVAKLLTEKKIYNDIVKDTGSLHSHNKPRKPHPELRQRRIYPCI